MVGFRKTLAASLAALTLGGAAVATMSTPADAAGWRGRGGYAGAWRGGGYRRGVGAGPVIAGAIGGLALGAIAAGAANNYGYGGWGGYNSGWGYGGYNSGWGNGGYYPAYSSGWGYPAYDYGYVQQTCVTRAATYDQWGNFAGYRRVRVAC